MVAMYADLVQLGLRTIKPEQEPDIIPVPLFLRKAVESELKKRETNFGA